MTRLRRMDPFRADVLLAAVLLAEMTVEVAFIPGPGDTRLWVWLVCVGQAVGVALRRRATIVGATMIAAGFLILSAIVPENTDTLEVPWFLILIGVYSVGANLDGWRLWLGASLSAVPATIGVVVAPDGDAGAAIFAGLILISAPLLVGRVMRHRSRLNRALRARTRQLEEERSARAEAAMLEERTRIAGELHDVVAHALSAMVVQASAARRLVPRDPQRAQAAFGSVETTGRDALTEIRSLLGVLRREDEDLALAPQPSLAHVSSLVRRTSAAGLPVALHVEGDARPLPAGVDLTAYRVLQAALGGALEHGGAGRAEVTVRYGAERVEVEVFDDGTGDGDARLLLGARERVALYGGDLRVRSGRRRAHGARAAAGRSERMRLPPWLRGAAGDRALALLLLATAVTEVLTAKHLRGPLGLNLLAVAMLTLPLAWRRRWPLGVLCFTMAAGTLQGLYLSSVDDVATIFFVVHRARLHRRRAPAAAPGVLGAAADVPGHLRRQPGHPRHDERLPVPQRRGADLVAVRPRGARPRAADRGAARGRDPRRGGARGRGAAAAMAEERRRIAREMHDVVAHASS